MNKEWGPVNNILVGVSKDSNWIACVELEDE